MSHSRSERFNSRIHEELWDLADKALSQPVTITKNGRDRLMMISTEEHARLKRGDRRVVRVEDFAGEKMAMIEGEVTPAGKRSGGE